MNILNPLKAVNELLNYKFVIPSYQRGYRWEKRQIVELLDDIHEFIGQKSKDKEFYCLQPVITKKVGDLYKVIDGQQRLTTTYIILSYLQKKRYSIEFETRPKSKVFLENLDGKIDESNIDFHYISHGYNYVKTWFEEKEKDEATIKDEFYIFLGKYTKFIWYEIENEDEIDVFTRTNSGKISLTNAELIKALFLNRKNFKNAEAKLKQIEIAKEWDEMEFYLQNDSFWQFLTEKKELPTRIELLFEIFSNTIYEDKYTTYRFFAQQKDIVKLWSNDEENIKKVFLSIKYWFEDKWLYHLIGYLIATSNKTYNVNKIYNDFYKQMKKSDFKKELKQIVQNSINLDELEELTFEDNYKDVFNILLLFNIANILNNKESYVRFAYDKFKDESWTIEHIHARNDKGTMSSDAIRKWLTDVKKQINQFDKKIEKKKSIIKSIDILLKEAKLNKEDKRFVDVRVKVFEIFGQPDVDNISNLALLSRSVNSSLSNNIFPIKREILIDKDKVGEFVPICTKNVFLKYYSKDISNMHYWGSNDRDDYIKEIQTVLSKFK